MMSSTLGRLHVLHVQRPPQQLHQTRRSLRAQFLSHRRHHLRCRAESREPSTTHTAETSEEPAATSTTDDDTLGKSAKPKSLEKEVTKFARGAATTFAPRASKASKNPAFKGSTLYTIFEVQAWASLVVGGLLSFNLIFPSDRPDIARLLGMWSIWMFTIPSLRARDCSAAEKDALNILFLLVPVINVALPFAWKNFAFIFSADVVALAAIMYWKLGLPAAANE